MGGDEQQTKVYQFDPGKKKLKSVKYVSPEKKQLIRERKQAQKDKRNFYIGISLLLLLVVVLSIIRLKF
ncbi:MAG: hypothetical protein ACOY30_05505 [Bacillota bacterium]